MVRHPLALKCSRFKGKIYCAAWSKHKIRNSTHSGMRKTIRAMKIGIDNARC